MTTVYNLCKLLIDRGRTDGLQDKMDVYLAADRLTPEEYQELAGCLPRPWRRHKKGRPVQAARLDKTRRLWYTDCGAAITAGG